jgi:hypothetical protein
MVGTSVVAGLNCRQGYGHALFHSDVASRARIYSRASVFEGEYSPSEIADFIDGAGPYRKYQELFYIDTVSELSFIDSFESNIRRILLSREGRDNDSVYHIDVVCLIDRNGSRAVDTVVVGRNGLSIGGDLYGYDDDLLALLVSRLPKYHRECIRRLGW